MIVATAGHIDHGKTLLVKALTGVDADRLPEEKRRGLTIDLGFAYLPVDGGPTIGFVDVPGHERFIRNMLAGVSGIDLALLIVAADDGPMPQTEEHLAILDLLDIRRGAVAVTKTDRVDEQRAAEVVEDIRILLAGTCLEDASIFPVSSPRGTGVAELREFLESMARAIPSRTTAGGFRLAVDRSFHLKGAGLVVTGAVFAGETHHEDRLMVTPGGLEVRVRGIHAQNHESASGAAGQRCALNLTGRGLGRDSVARGDWLVAPALDSPTRRFDARLKVLLSETRPLRHWTPVHVHVGAAALTGRVALLEDRSLRPGEAGLVQIVLDSMTSVAFGDRFVIRDQSARRTVGGGRVIDPFAPGRGRRTPGRLALIKATDEDDPEKALRGMCAASSQGIDLDRFAVARNLSKSDVADAAHRAGTVVAKTAGAGTAVARESWEQAQSGIAKAIAGHHAGASDSQGIPLDQLRAAAGSDFGRALFEAAVEDLVTSGTIVREAGRLRQAGHRTALPPKDAALWDRISPLLEADQGRPPSVPDLATSLEMPPRTLEQFLVRLGRQGLAVQVSRNRFMTPAMVRQLAGTAERVAAGSPNRRFTARMFRDATALGRNLTIEVLEFFDRSGFTRRIGDERTVLKPAADAFESLDA